MIMRFYVLTKPGHRHGGGEPTEFLSAEPKILGEPTRCPKCGTTLGMLPRLPPVRVELDRWGRQFDDIVFGTGMELLVSDRFWVLYRDAGLTGLIDVGPAEVVSVQSRDRKTLSPPEYRCVRVALGQAALDTEESGLVCDKPWTCEVCRSANGIIKRMEHLVLEQDTWADEDFFYARGLPGTIITTERVKEFCDRNRFNNVLLIPSEGYNFDSYPWELRKRTEG